MEQFVFGLGLLVKVFSAYFVVVALFALGRRQRYPHAAPRHKFAVVIAARNEEAVIGELVTSLRQQDYPQELYDIYVVPNNCDDDTAGAARRAGAQVLTCVHPVKNKGDVLHQTVSWLMQDESYDAFCVFDADNVVDRRFLSEMNNAFCAGVRVAKGRNESKNPDDSWLSGCYAIYFGMFNTFYNKARQNLGLSAKLVGTGFAVRREVLLRTGGWNTKTIAEDAEFAAQLAELGERVAWVPEAVAYDESPLNLTVSMVQRRRWISGIMQAGNLHLPELAARRGKGMPLRFDFIMFFLSPYIQALGFLTALLSLGLFAVSSPPLAFLLHVLGVAAASYGGATLMAALVVYLHGGWNRHIVKSILGYGLFMASWLPLILLSLFRRKTTWEVIAHNRSLSLERVA